MLIPLQAPHQNLRLFVLEHAPVDNFEIVEIICNGGMDTKQIGLAPGAACQVQHCYFHFFLTMKIPAGRVTFPDAC